MPRAGDVRHRRQGNHVSDHLEHGAHGERVSRHEQRTGGRVRGDQLLRHRVLRAGDGGEDNRTETQGVRRGQVQHIRRRGCHNLDHRVGNRRRRRRRQPHRASILQALADPEARAVLAAAAEDHRDDPGHHPVHELARRDAVPLHLHL